MSEQDKRCGTCKHFALIVKNYGECAYEMPKLPDSFPGKGVDSWTMGVDEGTTCPCWEAKEQ